MLDNILNFLRKAKVNTGENGTTVKQFSILTLGGTGCKIGGEICSFDWQNIGMVMGYDLDSEWVTKLKKKYEKKPGGSIKELTSEAGVIGAPAERDFLIGEIRMNQSENIKTLDRYLNPLGGGEQFVFVVFSAGGGTGHGFFRAISNKIKNLDRVIPVVVFPQTTDADWVILNSYATYGKIYNSLEKYKSVIFIDNNNFKKNNVESINKQIAGCLGTLTDAVGLMEICYRTINIGGALNTLQTGGKITTFGVGYNFFIPDGKESTKMAMKMACTSTFCDIRNDAKKNGIVFAVVPYRANVNIIKTAIQEYVSECTEKYRINIGDRIFISHANTYSVDIVLLISGKVYPKFLKQYSRDELPYENWHKGIIQQLKDIGAEDEINELSRSLDEDFEKGYENRM